MDTNNTTGRRRGIGTLVMTGMAALLFLSVMLSQYWHRAKPIQLPLPPEGCKSFSYQRFKSLEEYQQALTALAGTFPGTVRFDRRGTSAVGRYPLYVLVAGNPHKPVIMLEGGLHGRHEWHSTHIILNFIERIAQRRDAFSRELLDNYL